MNDTDRRLFFKTVTRRGFSGSRSFDSINDVRYLSTRVHLQPRLFRFVSSYNGTITIMYSSTRGYIRISPNTRYNTTERRRTAVSGFRAISISDVLLHKRHLCPAGQRLLRSSRWFTALCSLQSYIDTVQQPTTGHRL